MPLLKSGAFAQDGFVTLTDDDALPQTGDIIVSWQRLQSDFDSLKVRISRLGVAFPVTGDLAALEKVMFRIDVIALPFAAFNDGRAYSLARVIRTRLKFEGELRATGNVLPDQLAFMRQVGFDAFEVDGDRHGLDVWQKAATAVTVTYQKGFLPRRGFAPIDIFEARQARRTA